MYLPTTAEVVCSNLPRCIWLCLASIDECTDGCPWRGHCLVIDCLHLAYRALSAHHNLNSTLLGFGVQVLDLCLGWYQCVLTPPCCVCGYRFWSAVCPGWCQWPAAGPGSVAWWSSRWWVASVSQSAWWMDMSSLWTSCYQPLVSSFLSTAIKHFLISSVVFYDDYHSRFVQNMHTASVTKECHLPLVPCR